VRQDDIRRRISGRVIPLLGNDIDTDRIIPARFLKCITFEGLETHVFEDDRRQMPDHPFSRPHYQGATILLVGQNFGCGSSREHAPEALRRWGIRGIVGKSFAEIFSGNCTAIGLPCLALNSEDLAQLEKIVAQHPDHEIVLDLEDRVVRFDTWDVPALIPNGARNQLLTGTWNATGVLLEAETEIDRVAGGLPYITGY